MPAYLSFGKMKLERPVMPLVVVQSEIKMGNPYQQYCRALLAECQSQLRGRNRSYVDRCCKWSWWPSLGCRVNG